MPEGCAAGDEFEVEVEAELPGSASPLGSAASTSSVEVLEEVLRASADWNAAKTSSDMLGAKAFITRCRTLARTGRHD